MDYLKHLFNSKRIVSMLWFMFASVMATFIMNLNGDPFSWTWQYMKSALIAAVVFQVTKAWNNYKKELIDEMELPTSL